MTPYIGFGNETLEKQPVVHAGDKIRCDKCGQLHELRGGTENGKPSEFLLFYTCPATQKDYLGAVQNRLVTALKPDVSGAI